MNSWTEGIRNAECFAPGPLLSNLDAEIEAFTSKDVAAGALATSIIEFFAVAASMMTGLKVPRLGTWGRAGSRELC